MYTVDVGYFAQDAVSAKFPRLWNLYPHKTAGNPGPHFYFGNYRDGYKYYVTSEAEIDFTWFYFPNLPEQVVISNVVGALREDGTTYDVQWYQNIAGNVKILDNGVVKSQGGYPAGQNWNTLVGLLVGTHSICVEGA